MLESIKQTLINFKKSKDAAMAAAAEAEAQEAAEGEKPDITVSSSDEQ